MKEVASPQQSLELQGQTLLQAGQNLEAEQQFHSNPKSRQAHPLVHHQVQVMEQVLPANPALPLQPDPPDQKGAAPEYANRKILVPADHRVSRHRSVPPEHGNPVLVLLRAPKRLSCPAQRGAILEQVKPERLWSEGGRPALGCSVQEPRWSVHWQKVLKLPAHRRIAPPVH